MNGKVKSVNTTERLIESQENPKNTSMPKMSNQCFGGVSSSYLAYRILFDQLSWLTYDVQYMDMTFNSIFHYVGGRFCMFIYLVLNSQTIIFAVQAQLASK